MAIGEVQHADIGTELTKAEWEANTSHLIGGIANVTIVRAATLVVAASNSSPYSKASADYVCTGANDEVEINAAITALGVLGAGLSILLLAGSYVIDADITWTEASIIRGEGKGITILTLADGVSITNAAVTNRVENLSLVATTATAASVIASAGVMTFENCEISGFGAGDAIAMTAGEVRLINTEVLIGDIDLSTAPCTLLAKLCELFGPVDTAGAFAHVLALDYCDLNAQNIVSAATGATTLSMRSCTNVGTVTNAGTGTFTIRGSDVASVNQSNAGGDIEIFGGHLLACAGATGSVIWKTIAQQYEVIAGMVIGHAITAAAADAPAPAATAPYTILIHPGIYDEPITMATWVNLRGLGPRGAVVISQTDATVLTLATMVELQNLAVRLVTPTGGRNIIYDGGAAVTSRMTDLELRCTTPAGQSIYPFAVAGGGDHTIERCYFDIAGTGFSIGVNFGTSTVRLDDNDFTFSASTNAYHIYSTGAGALTGKGNRFSGICAMFNVTLGTVTLDNCALLATADWTVASAGAVIDIILRHCEIIAPVVAGNLSSVRLKHCSYRAISRTGTGDIVDESPEAKGYGFHTVKLPRTSLDNIATRTAIGGAVALGGSGQIGLRINDNAADAAGVENNADAAGTLTSSFTAGRTPRFVSQFSINVFRATTTAFWGLRNALGAAVPGAGEDHFGFDWDGTNFRAISSDGAGVGQQTNLALPGAGAQHQIEAIQFRDAVEFYVGGVLVATHTNAAGIPTAGGTLDYQEYQISDGLGGATTSDITLRDGFVAECPA